MNHLDSPKRGEIYFINSEEAPALVVSNDWGNQCSNIVTLAKISFDVHSVGQYEVLTKIDDKWAKIVLSDCITVDQSRLVKKYGKERREKMRRVNSCLKHALGIEKKGQNRSTEAPERGEIFWIENKNAEGDEVCKKRPVIVVSSCSSDTVTIAPLTTQKTDKIGNHEALILVRDKKTKVMTNQCRSVPISEFDPSEIYDRTGEEEMKSITKALSCALNLPYP